MGSVKTDICVLGGGIMGVSTAYTIRKNSDSQVLVLDRYGVGNEYCSSNDVNRVFRYSYGSDELYTKMAVESLRLWRELEEESEQRLLLQTGLLLLQGEDESANGFNEASHRTLSSMGLGADRLAKDELLRRFPEFRAEEAFFDPHGGVLLASKALRTLQSSAEALGAKFLQGLGKMAISGNYPRVMTDHDTIEFRKLVVTAGPWTNSILPYGLAKMTPTRQQIIYLQPPNGLDRFRPERCPVFFTDEHYGLPAAGIDAVKLSAKELAEPADPETVKRTVDGERISECRRICKKIVPRIADGKVFQTKVCLYDMTENSDFVIDRDPTHSNVVFGYGFSGHGFKFAPLIGRMLAELALDETPSFNLERFSAIPSKRRPPTLGAHLGQGK